MNETVLTVIKNTAKDIARQIGHFTQTIENMLIYAINKDIIHCFKAYTDEEMN